MFPDSTEYWDNEECVASCTSGLYKMVGSQKVCVSECEGEYSYKKKD